jgi:hypothetical protein
MNKLTPDAQPEIGSLFVLSMLPLVYANEIAIRLVPLLNHAADFFKVLGNQIGTQMPQLAFRLDFQSIQILQIALVLAGLFLAVLVKKLQLETTSIKPHLLPLHYTPLFLMAIISIGLY